MNQRRFTFDALPSSADSTNGIPTKRDIRWKNIGEEDDVRTVKQSLKSYKNLLLERAASKNWGHWYGQSSIKFTYTLWFG